MSSSALRSNLRVCFSATQNRIKRVLVNGWRPGRSARKQRAVPVALALILGICLVPLFRARAESSQSGAPDGAGLLSQLGTGYRLFPRLTAALLPDDESGVDLGVTKTTSADTVNPDTDVTYTVVVYNGGPDAAIDATLSDTLPAGMTFVSVSSPDGWDCTTPSPGSGGTVTCVNPSLGTTGPGGEVFMLVAHVPSTSEPGQFFTNTATIATSSLDPNDENNSSSAGIVVGANSADVGVEKSVDSDTVKANADITYTLRVQTSANADNVALHDTLPGDLTFVSLTQKSGPSFSCTVPNPGESGSIDCTLASFPAGGEAVFTLVAHVPAQTADGTEYTNTATVGTSTQDSNEENNSSTITSTVLNCDNDTVVTTTADSGAGSLRQAIANACPLGIVTFSASLAGPITLTSDELLIDKNLTIRGPGAKLLTITRQSGAPSFRIFNVTNGSVSISGLTITNGSTASGTSGGGINNASSLTLKDVNINGNTADAAGGGISNTGTLNIVNSNINGNSGGSVGGINNTGTLSVMSSLVSGNAADTDAGGILSSGTLNLSNSTVSGNSAHGNGAGSGGGLYLSGTATLANVTVTNNRANSETSGTGTGGGIYVASGIPLLSNTIVAGNFKGSGTSPDDIAGANVNIKSSFNLIGTGGAGGLTATDGNQVDVADPRLGPLADNGGLTWTHALLPGSPALEAGSNALIPTDTFDLDNDLDTAETVPFDQRGTGFLRVRDAADADTTQTVDVGAYETQVSIEDIGDKVTDEDTLLSFSFNVADVAIITSVTAESSNTTLVPNSGANIGVSGTGSTRTLSILPAANQSGKTTITVTVRAVNAQTVTDTFELTVNAVNDAPAADSQSVVTGEDTPKAITLTGSDADSNTLNFIIVDNPSHGSLSGAAPNVTYTPEANYNGADSFTFKINDGSVDSNLATVSITVNSVNDAPQATGESYSTNENTALNVAAPGVLGNDTDIDNATLSAVKVTNPSHGTVTLNSNGSFTYTPQAGFSGEDSFTYKANDGGLDSNTATVSITVNEGGDFAFNSASYSINENGGSATITIIRTGASTGTATVLFSTSNGTASSSDYAPVSQTLTFNDGETSKTVSVSVIDDTLSEPDETVNLTLSNAGGTGELGVPSTSVLTILNDDLTRVQFALSEYTISEAATLGFVSVRVTRTGDTSQPLSVDYRTSDQAGTTPCQTNNTGLASERCDYTTAAGSLRFDAGEVSKDIPVVIINDAYVEPKEQFTITLSNPQGASLGSPDTATIFIADNDTQAATKNPIDDLDYFIYVQYADFLGRVPDADGFQFWKDRMTGKCPEGQTCDRIDTSLRFFSSDEFKLRGYFVYLFYHASLGRRPTYSEWILDVAKLNGFQTPAEQEANKAAFVNEFINRTEFRNLYDPFQTGDEFVNALVQQSGVTPENKQQLIDNYAVVGRAATVRAFMETPEVQAAFVDRGFVTMLYFGYLRRDAEPGGFDFWMQKLIETNHDYRQLVGGFIDSDEFRYRFAQVSSNP
jgi:uncharacterized repeat protein (TIGR01451 family)